MEKIQEMIDTGYISLEDIQDYLMAINKEIIDVDKLMALEDSLHNHPG